MLYKNVCMALLTKGCNCHTGCLTLHCSCRKSGNQCFVGCERINCVNLGDESHPQEVSDDLSVDGDINFVKEQMTAHYS